MNWSEHLRLCALVADDRARQGRRECRTFETLAEMSAGRDRVVYQGLARIGECQAIHHTLIVEKYRELAEKVEAAVEEAEERDMGFSDPWELEE